MILLNRRKQAFSKLGEYLRLVSELSIDNTRIEDLFENFKQEDINTIQAIHEQVLNYIEYSTHTNPWFIQDFLLSSIKAIGESLSAEKLDKWLKKYENEISANKSSKTIGVVMAGNLPLVGFHDYLSVLISGNRILAKLSQDDNKLLPLLHQILVLIEPEFKNQALFTQEKLSDFDAIIATGSDNTARYFEYYFGKYPNIIRKNRNGVAVLNGEESAIELEALADDIFMYFGLGCRSVSKLFVPRGYDFKTLFSAFKKYEHLAHHSKYANNYDYNKSIFLINKIKFQDTGFVLLKEDTLFSSPISVLYFEFYDKKEDLNRWMESQRDKIQCLLSNEAFENFDHFPFGKAQQPELWDYADGIDTLQFILSLK